MENYRTVYLVNPSKRNYDGLLDGVTYRIPAKGFLPVVHFVASHLKGANESLEEFEGILDVMKRIKELGTYEVYFVARAGAEEETPENAVSEDIETEGIPMQESSEEPPVE